MGKTRVDILIEISFDINNPAQTVVKTNARKEALEELLDTWLRGQIGQGRDAAAPNTKDIYTIKIGLDLSDDTFFTESDTGNKSLTCGLVMDVFRRLESIQALPL